MAVKFLFLYQMFFISYCRKHFFMLALLREKSIWEIVKENKLWYEESKKIWDYINYFNCPKF